ncbi:MAG: hypothetical protein WC813_00975 [Patescibacteria group bacterium]|jgi:hypothetical protein
MFVIQFAHEEVDGLTADQFGIFEGVTLDADDLFDEVAMANVDLFQMIKPKQVELMTHEMVVDEPESVDNEENDEVELESDDNVAPNAEPDEYAKMALEHGDEDWDTDYNAYGKFGLKDDVDAGYWTPKGNALITVLSRKEMDAVLVVEETPVKNTARNFDLLNPLNESWRGLDDDTDSYWDLTDVDDEEDGSEAWVNFLESETARDPFDSGVTIEDELRFRSDDLEWLATAYRPKVRDVFRDKPGYVEFVLNRKCCRDHLPRRVSWKDARRGVQCKSVNGRRDRRRHTSPM